MARRLPFVLRNLAPNRLLRFLEWLPGYRASHFMAVLFAGLTVALVLVPQSMGYAQLAGLLRPICSVSATGGGRIDQRPGIHSRLAGPMVQRGHPTMKQAIRAIHKQTHKGATKKTAH